MIGRLHYELIEDLAVINNLPYLLMESDLPNRSIGGIFNTVKRMINLKKAKIWQRKIR